MASPAWPATREELATVQRALAAAAAPTAWRAIPDRIVVAGCFVCFERGGSGPGRAGDRAWAAAVVVTPDGGTAGAEGSHALRRIIRGLAAAPYEPGFLALREGPLLEAAVLALPATPDLVVVDATGRDHPRRAGLALHLGARLGLPTIGVTDRPLAAAGPEPPDVRGATSPLALDGEVVAAWVRTRRGTRPVVAHAGWGTSVEDAVALVRRLTERWRTPVPLRLAREVARTARAEDT